MTDTHADQTAASKDHPADPADTVLRVGLHKDDAIWKLEVMSRRGRLPGFRRMLGGCAVAAHGNPFDKTLLLHAAETTGGTTFTPELRLERRMPTIAAIIFILTVWPGVLLADSFMRLHLEFYSRWTTDGLQTWWWYIPLTVLSLAWAWRSAINKSHATATASARETLSKIAAELNGDLRPRAAASAETPPADAADPGKAAPPAA